MVFAIARWGATAALLCTVAACHAHSVPRATPPVALPAWAPDGRHISWSEAGRIWIARRDMSHARPLTPPLDALGEVAWLSDGSLLYWADARVFRVDASGRSHLVTVFGGDNFALAPGGRLIATGDPGCSTGCDGGILVLDLKGHIRREISPHTQATDPSFSPTGTRLVFARNLCDRTGRCERPVGIWVAAVASKRLRRLTRTGCCPSWSPDGRWIAYGVIRGVRDFARVVPSEGGPSVGLSPAQLLPPLLWSPDSKHVAGLSAARELIAIDVNTRRARALTSHAVGPVLDFAWSPDSSELLVAARPRSPNCALWLVRLSGGTPRVLRRC